MGVIKTKNEGHGVKTLVLFSQCPLKCEYCLDRLSMESGIKKDFTATELYKLLSIDSNFYEVPQGGVTFGGGEPALQSQYIKEVYNLSAGKWKIKLETTLHAPIKDIERLAEFVETFYVDIKDMNPEIYQQYTGVSPRSAYTALEWLSEKGFASKVIVRVPLIQRYNTEADQLASIQELTRMGFKTELTSYVRTRKLIKKPIVQRFIEEIFVTQSEA